MANDVARGRTKTTFVRVHGAELSAQAEHEAEKLNDAPVSPSLRGSIEAAIELSSDIAGAIDELRVSPQDREQAHRGEAKLHHWADENRGVIARAAPDVKDLLIARELERLAHTCHYQRLGDHLPVPDWQRPVLPHAPTQRCRYEQLARYGGDRGEHPLIADIPSQQSQQPLGSRRR